MTCVQVSIQTLSDPVNFKQISPNRPDHVPNFGAQIPTNAIKGAFFTSFSHHLDSESLDTVNTAVLSPLKVSVPHQGDAVAINIDDAVDHMAATFYLGQHHMPDPKRLGLYQHNAFAPPDDKGVHAPAIYRERHLHALAYQADGFGKDLFISGHVSLHPHCHKNQNELYGSRRLFEAPG